jgi:hypothetical protein
LGSFWQERGLDGRHRPPGLSVGAVVGRLHQHRAVVMVGQRKPGALPMECGQNR